MKTTYKTLDEELLFPVKTLKILPRAENGALLLFGEPVVGTELEFVDSRK